MADAHGGGDCYPIGASTALRFGRAFGEASGPRPAVGIGRSCMVSLRDGFPVNVLNPVKSAPGVYRFFRVCAVGESTVCDAVLSCSSEPVAAFDA